MTETQITFRLVRGLLANCDDTLNANDVYFATDKGVIRMGGKNYGASSELVAQVGQCIDTVTFTSPGTFKFTRVGGGVINAVIPTASASTNGLMAKDMVDKLNKSVKSIAFSGNTATVTLTDGTASSVTIPVATSSANGAMSKEQAALLSTLNTKVATLTSFMNTKGKAGGLATLDDNGRVPVEQIPNFFEDISFFYGQKASITDPTDMTGTSPNKELATWQAGDVVIYAKYANATPLAKTRFFLKRGNVIYERWVVPEGADTVFTSSTNYNTSESGGSPYKSVLYVSLESMEEQYADGSYIWRYGGPSGAGSLVNITSNINVINALTSTSATAALSAAQGKALKDMVDKLVKTVTMTSPGVFKVTLQDGTSTTLTIPAATTSANGLMAKEDKVKLNASLKEASYATSIRKLTFTRTDGTTLDVTLPLAGVDSTGLMTADHVNTIHLHGTQLESLITNSHWHTA